MNRLFSLIACSLSAALATSASATVAMDYVRVGNPNNAADPTTSYGAVDHAYWIGKYEVTNAQYAEFLKAKGQSNANGIYNSSMSSYGITQTGSSGSYSYTVSSALANRPVVFVSWFDAARFANWMSNGQGNGDMETGAYTLNGATDGIIMANAGAKVYIPSENEWYKAAYYNGVNASYSLYPNGQNTITAADANYNSIESTDVGTYSSDPSSYGTYDQGGNVYEWNDAVISSSSRGVRAGSWTSEFANYEFGLQSSARNPYGLLDAEVNAVGFRVAAASIDTDSDGIDDLAETNRGIYISATNTGTNPNSADTDADGVPDGLEVKEKTSPVDATKFNAFSKGMVAHYHFDGNAKDTTGNGNTGIETNVTYASDRSAFASSAGDFRQNAYVEVPNLHSLKNYPITCSAWIYLETYQTNLSWNGWGDMFILGKDQPGIVGSVIGLHTNAQFTNALSYTDFQSNYVPSLKKWMQVALTINSDRQAALYVDGSQTASWQASTAEFTDLPFLISTPYIFNQFARQSFQGYLDDIRIYDRALAPSEVAALYSSEVPPKPHFQIIQGSYTWQQAKADAEARGGRLAVLNTQAKIDEADTLLATSGYPLVWIGLTDEIQEGVFKWVNGDPLTISRWGPGQPDNASNEDYVHYYYGTFWNDLREIEGHGIAGYLLEFPKQILAITSPTHGTITGAGEYDSGTFATLTATPDAGYTFTGWTGDASGTTNPLTLTMDADKTVGATFAADLSDADADGLTAYDEVTLYHTDPAKADTDGDGLTDLAELGRNRFMLVLPTSPLTFTQAMAGARNQGGYLATFASQAEYEDALAQIPPDTLLNVAGLWIGASDEQTEDQWRWLTGEQFTFTKWALGEPNNRGDSDYAAIAGDLGGELGSWYDYRGIVTRDGYILEKSFITDPLLADTDGDGILDSQEIGLRTSPNVADTDGDGSSDGSEIEFGGDPIIPSVSPQWKANLQNQNSSSGFELRFPTRAGEVYQIEACSDLIDWSVLETGIQGTGSTLSRTYASEGRAKRYFRVQRN